MALVCSSIWTDLILFLVTLITIFVLYLKWSLKYWENKKFPYLPPTFPFGNMKNPFKGSESVGEQTKGFYDQFKARNLKHGGIYFLGSARYMPVDPEYIKQVLTVGFQHFTDRGIYYNEEVDPLSAHLFSLNGKKWRNLRAKLTPTFTSGKMKMMFQTLVECSAQMEKAMDGFYNKKEPVDVKEVLACFTTDVIGSCAFGIDCNSFQGKEIDIRKYGSKIFRAKNFQLLKVLICITLPKLSRFLGIPLTPSDTTEFFLSMVKDTVKYREENNVIRKDFLQLLIDIKNHKGDEENENDGELNIEQLTAQAYVFFIAGYETSSTTSALCLYELALHPDIQEKVRQEIDEVLKKHDGKITYEAIIEMKYMQQVVDETLRKYPSLPVIYRKCTIPYKIPDSDIILEEGTMVDISALGIHHDPEYFPDPEKFDPERFTEENKRSIRPYTYLPFGEGPRICIGLRFGLMQTKMGLTALLRNYRFSRNSKTPVPMEFDPYSFILSCKGEIWLDIEKIED